MLASSTVENYLKTVYQAQADLTDETAMVPMGQLAAALGVVPGTATTMVKTLAESGLVAYEPYVGVRLTGAGQRLAAMVLRRHRLIEQFLVQVMGMSWTEVHDEAEKLEHAVSDRLIERIDDMLGHPAVDPHGDPIPGPEGTVPRHEYQSLLTCPLNQSVIVTRVADQDAEFLRFIEVSDLKPGQPIEVEARDSASDSVRVRGKDERRITIGMRAASKLLVELVGFVFALLLASATPAAAQTTGPLSGYMDFHFNKVELQDGRLDFHRFVLLFTHSFSERLRFVSELEVEHALVEGLEEAGEIELEQAYLDFLISRGFNVRAGMLLIPVGIINERHEPPVYYGVERSFVDTVIIPSTWFEVGAGVHGELRHGLRYRAYITSPLNAAEFSAEEGLREGRQKGADTNIGRVATTGRLEWLGRRGLVVGTSFWTGRSGFEFRPRFDVPVTVTEVDARYAPNDRLELRAQFARASIGNAAILNDALTRQIGVNPNIARSMRGFYLESGYRVVSGSRAGDVGAFVRYENFDTQHRMPEGYLPLKQFDRDGWVFGATYWPDADVAIKVDYTVLRNQSQVVKALDSFNVGLGWWF